MALLGVDPGLKGALSLIKEGSVEAVLPMPLTTRENSKGQFIDLDLVIEWITVLSNHYSIDKVFIEKQIVVSKQGLSSSGKTMYQFGLLEGLLVGLGLDPIILSAKQWQGTIFPKVDDTFLGNYKYPRTKLLSIAYVKQYYPADWGFLFVNKRKKPSDGIADAISIASFGLYNV
jgi:hypothetical protein